MDRSWGIGGLNQLPSNVANELVIAVVGVGGTVIGAIGANISQFVNGGRQRKWAVADAATARTEERRARLFDHRRTAYTDFHAEYQRYYDLLWPYVYDVEPGPGPDYDSFDSLISKRSRVKMYGSKDAARTAKDLSDALIKWSDSGTKTRDALYKVVESAEEAFLAACRLDLGVDE